MRVLVHSAVPWATSGYGLQCGYLARALQALGHEVAVSGFGGVLEAESKWEGLTILGVGGRPFGNGAIALNYRRWRAELLITLGDAWMFDARQFDGLKVMPVMPIDCDPLGVMDRQWLEVVTQIADVRPVAMSEFGRQILEEAGYPRAPVLPHATTFTPSKAARAKWRADMKVAPGTFIISKVGVNDDEDRKAFGITMHAFAEFSRDKDDVALYLHTEAQRTGKRAPNLVWMAMQLGINQPGRRGKLVFCDQERRLVDGFDQHYMRGMYCATDVLDACTKAEGFGCPVIDALACGTPVIVADNSAMPEKLGRHIDENGRVTTWDPRYGWLVGGQPEWAPHHQSAWQTPYITSLIASYNLAYVNARRMRSAAAKAGAKWSNDTMQKALAEIIATL